MPNYQSCLRTLDYSVIHLQYLMKVLEQSKANNNMLIKAIPIFMALLIAACTSLPDAKTRSLTTEKMAKQHGWEKRAIDTDLFVLQAFLPSAHHQTDTLTIYLEGDGLAWLNPTTPSDNPTPVNPLAFKLALLDTGAAAYLARPCQYVAENQSKNCLQKYWTSHRFSAAVIESTQQAINQLKREFNASRLILVGYSGGGSIAALVASKRDDVIKLVTVAGNLDHVYWTKQRHLSPLSGSLNPSDAWMALQKIPQQHYVGAQDTIVGESVVQSYASKFKVSDNIHILVLPDFDHHCCWESVWQSAVKSHFGNVNPAKP